jgi:hypothetical protein
MNILSLALVIISTAVGYEIAKFFAGKHESVEGRLPSVIFRVQEYKVHIHHWMWSSAIGVVLLLLQFRNVLVYGLLVGITLQGLHYRNRFRIIYKA